MRHISLPVACGFLMVLALGLLIGRATAPSVGGVRSSPEARNGFDESQLVDVLATPDLRQRGPRLLALLDRVSPDAVPSVRASYERLRPNLDASAILALVDWWARFDPESALAYARTFGDFSDIAVVTVVRRWAQQDPRSARDRLEADQAARSQPKAVVALVRGWGESGRPGAWSYVEKLPVGALRQQAIAALVHQLLLREGPEATIAFVEGLPDPGPERFKLQVFRQTAAALATRNPDFATAWAERHAGGPLGDGLLTKVAMSWVFLDGGSTVSWLAGLKADDAQQNALRSAYGFWLQRERERARAWLRGKGASRPALDPAWALLAMDVGHQDPAAGLDLLSSTNIEQGLQQKVTIALARVWLERDRDAAQAWLDGSGLPANVVQEIRATPSPPRRRVGVHASGVRGGPSAATSVETGTPSETPATAR